MSRPESVSSRTARSGSRTAIWRISLRFFSPPEKPSLRGRLKVGRVHLDDLELVLEEAVELDGVQFRLPSVLPEGVVGSLEEFLGGYARDLIRVLEGHEDAFPGAFLGGEVKDGVALVKDVAPGAGVGLVAGEDSGEGALARAVGPHDGVELARVYGQVDSLEDFNIADSGVKVSDFKQLKFLHLSCGAFQADTQKSTGLHCEFERQLLDDFPTEAADYEADGVLGGDASLLAVEELLFVDLGGGGLVLHVGGAVFSPPRRGRCGRRTGRR